MKLEDVATVHSGLVLSRRRSDSIEGIYYPLLTLRAVQPEGYVNLEELDEFYAVETLSGDYVTRKDDIVVRLSAPYTAVLIGQETAGMVVSSNFVLIRVDPEKMLPAYLYWLLNTRKVKNSIYENSTGNMLAAVKSSYFAEFKIYPISLMEQVRIAELNQLSKRESFLLKKLAAEKEKYYTAVLDKIQKEVRKHDKS